ncbi:flavin reductase family protein [Streptomyces netropsis]
MVSPLAGTTAPVTPDAFRAVMGAHPGGVSVVTSADASGQPYGFACTAVCSVSLDPPMLLVCASNTGSTLPVLAARGAFVVNFLHGPGRRAAEAFASRTAGRFSRVPWEPAPATGLPALREDSHALAECRVERLVPAGDHTVVIGEVLRTEIAEDPAASGGSTTAPLLYGMRRYVTWPI